MSGQGSARGGKRRVGAVEQAKVQTAENLQGGRTHAKKHNPVAR